MSPRFSCLVTIIFLLGSVQSVPVKSEPKQELEHINILRYHGPLTIEELKVPFDKIGRLEIRLSKITGLSKDIMNRFTNLENLIISDSYMEKVEDDIFIDCCPKLKKLKINNWIEMEENDLRGIGKLPMHTLHILEQNIPILKSGVFQNENLKTLKLVRDNIAEIQDEAFVGIPNLDYLLISNNKIKTIPKQALAPLKNLDTIELIANGIESFTVENLPDLPKLTEVIIIRENLKEVNVEGLEKVAPKLTDVYFIGNKEVHDIKESTHFKVHNWI